MVFQNLSLGSFLQINNKNLSSLKNNQNTFCYLTIFELLSTTINLQKVVQNIFYKFLMRSLVLFFEK